MTTVAEQFAEMLAVAGVKRIYGIVGDSGMLPSQPGIFATLNAWIH